MTSKSLQVVLVGCGAVSEIFYTPALRELENTGLLRVIALVDPSETRRDYLGLQFPTAEKLAASASLQQTPDIAIIATPPALHAIHVIEFLKRGSHVLCEKPMASSVKDCDAMIGEANRSDRLLAIGLSRRFLPATSQISEIITSETLGSVKSFSVTEGSKFQWLAKSDSFFRKSTAGGGVLMDIGVHVLDLLLWWFGEPSAISYEDDAMGGLEANCNLQLRYSPGFAGTVRLSRDWNMNSRYYINFQRGWIGWRPSLSAELEFGLSPGYSLRAGVHERVEISGIPLVGNKGDSFQHSFIRQIENFAHAVVGKGRLAVPAADGARSIRLIEACYQKRQFISMPWLTNEEILEAQNQSC